MVPTRPRRHPRRAAGPAADAGGQPGAAGQRPLARRTLCLTELAPASPIRPVRRVAAPEHDLLHRLKRLWCFLGNERVDPLAVQLAAVPHAVPGSGTAAGSGWLSTGRSSTPPRRGRAVPLLQLAVDRDRLPTASGQNRLEEARWAVVTALPPGARPVVLTDHGFAGADLLAALQRRGLDYVVRLNTGT